MPGPVVVLLVVLAVAVVLAAAVLVVLRRRRRRPTPVELPPPVAPESPPMTGLESALSQATDRSGRSLREHLDAETAHVDDLRVPDDTGPLLRRALDHVSPSERAAAAPADASADDDQADTA